MPKESEIVNILLLGETGVGKSTFINALAYYLTYKNLTEAGSSKFRYLVPTKFSLHDSNLEEKVIEVGSSINENTEPGVSSTRNVQSYLLKYGATKLRLIDTPGIGDTRGIPYDQENTEKLLTFIGELHHINSVCILLKPNNSRFSVLFNYCLNHVLLRLDKDIQKNIVFLFTNARSSFYTPGDTYLPLKTMLNELKVKKLSIPFNASNVFCIDNESFRYLAAKSTGFAFDQEDVEEFEDSWTKSSETCKRMIDYISTLSPAPMRGLISINECRRLIGRLGRAIIQLLVLHEKAINTLTNHEIKLMANQDTLSDLQSQLYIPVTRYRITQTSGHKKYDSGGFKGGLNVSSSYPFISLDLGYQHTWVDVNYIETTITPYVTFEQDSGLQNAVRTKSEALKIARKLIQDMQELKRKYKNESDVILKVATRFTIFLQENAILNTADVFENYLGRLMRDESITDGDEKLVEAVENVIVNYRQIKNVTHHVTTAEIEDSKGKLLKLKFSGSNFEELLDKDVQFGDKEIE